MEGFDESQLILPGQKFPSPADVKILSLNFLTRAMALASSMRLSTFRSQIASWQRSGV